MHPILFQIGDFFIGTYGIFIVMGVGAGLAMALHLAKRTELPSEALYDLVFINMIAGFAGARVFFILLNLDLFFADPLGLIFSRDGFVFMGGFAAAVPATLLYLKRKGLPIWEVADVGAPALVLAHGFGRIHHHGRRRAQG